MMRKLVKIEHGVPKLSQPLAELMAGSMVKEAVRYALDCVLVEGNDLVVTDGRSLLVVTIQTDGDTGLPKSKIVDGCYHLTGEGFLLKLDEDKKFPKWRDVIPTECEDLGDYSLDAGTLVGVPMAIMAISKKDGLFNLHWLLKRFLQLQDCSCSMVTVWFSGKDRPLKIMAEAGEVRFTYIQMPLHWEGSKTE